MKFDEYGNAYCDANYLCDILYKNPSVKIENFLVKDPESYNKAVKLFHADLPILKKYNEYFADRDPFASVEEFDKANQQEWFMPDSYKNLAIDEYIINLCNSENEFARVQQELILFQDRNLFNLLRYLKYLVDTLRVNNIVWGVGRGSSVASYVLFLLGVHKIDSLKYELDIEEFLK